MYRYVLTLVVEADTDPKFTEVAAAVETSREAFAAFGMRASVTCVADVERGKLPFIGAHRPPHHG